MSLVVSVETPVGQSRSELVTAALAIRYHTMDLVDIITVKKIIYIKNVYLIVLILLLLTIPKVQIVEF